MSRIKVQGPTPPEILEAVKEKMQEARIPGQRVQFTPEEAAWAGGYPEDALSEQDGLDSSDDLNNAID